VFTPYKNCNIETRSRDYATVDEVVFSPCRAEQCQAEPSRGEPSRTKLWTSHSSRRIVSPPLLPGNSYKHLDEARVGNGHMTASAVPSRVSSDAIKAFSHLSDAGFIGVRSSSYQPVLRSSRELLIADSRGRLLVKMTKWRVNRRTDLCVIIEVWNCYSCVLRAVAGKRLVETEKS
jgi:hypothetical protein